MTSADDSRIKDIIYKRKNGENIINDPEAIASCKNEQSRDVIDNARLGSYDKFGNYIIIPDIKRELLSMPKLVYNVKSQGDKTIYELKSTIPVFGDVFFKLTFSSSEAVLTLTETVNREANGYLEIYDELLDSLATGSNGLPQDIIFRNYHVVETQDDLGKTLGANDFKNILTRKVYLSLLSKELREVSKFDEHQAFDEMVATLKGGGEYGLRVLKEFTARLKERPGIFEITQTEKYNKAVNEVLLSSLDIATTQEDKENQETRQIYLKVLNARNKNIQNFLDEANAKIDESFVNLVVDKATKNFLEENQEDETISEFFDRIKDKNSVPTKRKLDKPILKQGKDEAKKSKEDKIKSILDKKEGGKKTPAGKKLKAGKSAQSKSSKLKGGKKAGGKKKGKPKLKNKKKKIKKAKALQKAKAKAGGKLKPAEGKKKAGKKKAEEKNVTIKMALVTPNNITTQNIMPTTQSIVSQVRGVLNQPKVQQEQQNEFTKQYAGVVTQIKDNTKDYSNNKLEGLTQEAEGQAKNTIKSLSASAKPEEVSNIAELPKGDSPQIVPLGGANAAPKQISSVGSQTMAEQTNAASTAQPSIVGQNAAPAPTILPIDHNQ